MNKNPKLYKTLVVGVIVLFIGVGVQPAIAITPNTSDSEDDCNLCAKKIGLLSPIISDILIDELDKLITKLSTMSKQNPELEEKYQEVSNKFDILTEKYENYIINDGWTMEPYPVFICLFLEVFYAITFGIACILMIPVEILNDFDMIWMILGPIFFPPFLLFWGISGWALFKSSDLNCFDP